MHKVNEEENCKWVNWSIESSRTKNVTVQDKEQNEYKHKAESPNDTNLGEYIYMNE